MIEDVLVGIVTDLQMLKTAFGKAMKMGPVEQINPVKGYRLRLGEGPNGPFLSPWYPHPETGKSSVPLKKGQVVGVVNPTGDPRQGFLIRGGYSDAYPSPNDDMDANVFEDAGVRLSIAGGTLRVAVGDVTFEISAAGVTISGGEVRHDGKNIGSTHVHGGILPGGADTDGPH